jgi:hypothetical protein
VAAWSQTRSSCQTQRQPRSQLATWLPYSFQHLDEANGIFNYDWRDQHFLP